MALREKNARLAEHLRQHRLRAAAARGDRTAGADRTRAASGESRCAAPGGEGAGSVPGTATAMANFLMVRGIQAARRA
jgi:hypothetical protein